MAFYNNSNVLMKVSEKQLLSSWKEFFRRPAFPPSSWL